MLWQGAADEQAVRCNATTSPADAWQVCMPSAAMNNGGVSDGDRCLPQARTSNPNWETIGQFRSPY